MKKNLASQTELDKFTPIPTLASGQSIIFNFASFDLDRSPAFFTKSDGVFYCKNLPQTNLGAAVVQPGRARLPSMLPCHFNQK
jgi:hypothetical protein